MTFGSSSSSKRESLHETFTADKRLKIVSELANISGVSKGGLAKTLSNLHSKGLLTDKLVSAPSDKGYQRQVKAAYDHPASICTPYGNLLNDKQLPTDDNSAPFSMHFVNPFALIYHLCSINIHFFKLFQQVHAEHHGNLRIVIYIDEVNPGNPLAPDPQQLLEAIYWCIPECPYWFLRRKDSWFCFALLRSMNAHRLKGDISELMAQVLLLFFPEVGPSFARGITVSNGDVALTFTATFAGFLADEKGLKEVFAIKGQAGSVPCFSHLNCRNRWCTLSGTEHYFWDTDRSKRLNTTPAHVKAITDRLSAAAVAPIGATPKLIKSLKNRLSKMETNTGINYCPTGPDGNEP
jgi:hypothetical protein